jgi:hypothetical protein
MDEPVSSGKIAKELARLPGRLEVDDGERRRIVVDLFERAVQGEFAESDVLMRTAGAAQLFEPFLPAYRLAYEKEWRRGAKLDGDPDSDVYCSAIETPYFPITGTNRGEIIQRTAALRHALQKKGVMNITRTLINMQAIFLRRAAVLHYLRTCDLEGASRLLRQWFPEADGDSIVVVGCHQPSRRAREVSAGFRSGPQVPRGGRSMVLVKE